MGNGADAKLRHPDKELQALIADAEKPGTLLFTLNQLQHSADEIRERISPDLYQFLNQLDDLTRSLINTATVQQLSCNSDALNQRIMQFGEILTVLVAITGLTHENLTHGDGWRFITLGRRVERARFGATVLRHNVLQNKQGSTHASPGNNTGNVAILENLLHVFDSIMTYRSRHQIDLSSAKVLHLLLQDESNPRSVAFQLAAINDEVLMLPGVNRNPRQNRLLRLASNGLSHVRLVDANELFYFDEAFDHLQTQDRPQTQNFSTLMHTLESIPAELANTLAANYFTHTETRNALGSQA